MRTSLDLHEKATVSSQRERGAMSVGVPSGADTWVGPLRDVPSKRAGHPSTRTQKASTRSFTPPFEQAKRATRPVCNANVVRRRA